METSFMELKSAMALPLVGMMLLRLSLSITLGAMIAFRPWRRVLNQPAPRREMVHAQILIALAGAIVVTVVGDSLARAFGLVGLGGFIRFRTGIRDPRDAAVFFLLIGLGMACGLGALGVAGVCALFVGGVVLAMDMFGNEQALPYVRVIATGEDPLIISTPVREALEQFPVILRSTNLKLDLREVRFDVENPKAIDIGLLQEAILERTDGMVVSLTCEKLETIKGARV